jgi:predicted lipoprotein with Yx(FWY)xxD motif
MRITTEGTSAPEDSMRIRSCTTSTDSRGLSAAHPPGAHHPRRRWIAACSSAFGVALIATACSSGTSSGSATTSAAASGASAAASAASAAPSAAAAQLLRVTTTAMGPILVDSTGKAIYVFAIDKPGQSVCTGTCLQYWPVVAAPDPLPATLPGVTAKLGVLHRADGGAQLTVNDYPVYTFAGDTGPGTTKGQGKNLSGGLWWIIAPNGKWITTSGTGSDGSTTNSSPTKGY